MARRGRDGLGGRLRGDGEIWEKKEEGKMKEEEEYDAWVPRADGKENRKHDDRGTALIL
jgi:hypothetical protein